MDTQELIQQAKALHKRIQSYQGTVPMSEAAKAQVCEFLHTYAGRAFVARAEKISSNPGVEIDTLRAILNSFIEYLEAGLASGLSPERKAQLDVVSDILEQANRILEDEKYHPAVGAVLIGASLEEFLRTWVETAGLSIGNSKPGIDAYCKALREADLISKQDVKDITSWGGIRNHAAHGEWEQVSDRGRIRLMLEGVNLFMRKKS